MTFRRQRHKLAIAVPPGDPCGVCKQPIETGDAVAYTQRGTTMIEAMQGKLNPCHADTYTCIGKLLRKIGDGEAADALLKTVNQGKA